MLSLYTVEQLELIRRLRQTGINPEGIIEAFRSLEHLDHELGAVGVNGRQTMMQLPLVKPKQAIHSPPLSSASPASSDDRQSVNSGGGHDGNPVLLQHLRRQVNPIPVTVSAAPRMAPPMTHAPMLLSSLSTPSTLHQLRPLLNPAEASQALASRLHTLNVPMATSAGTPPGNLGNAIVPEPLRCPSSVVRGINRPRPEVEEFITVKDRDEFDEFVKQGEEACIAQMKHFVGQYQLRQTSVAQMTGVSQPYISKFLNGNYRELSLRVRTNIFAWFLNCRRNPEKMLRCFAEPLPVRTTEAPNSNGSVPKVDNTIPPSMVDANGMPIYARRERYVFRPLLLKILEFFYQHDQYPDFEKRLEISAHCNKAMAAEKNGSGAPLVTRELMTPQVVANWFANRRKEIKRKLGDTSTDSPNSPDQNERATPPLFAPSLVPLPSEKLPNGVDNSHSNDDSPPPAKRPSPAKDEEIIEEGPKMESETVADPLTDLQTELEAVNSSVLALVNPYGSQEQNGIKVESPLET